MALECSIVPVTAYMQNCSILKCTETGKAVVVDPGGNLDRIIDQLDKMNASLEQIWVTHGHLDHCSAASDLRQKYAVSIQGPHKADAFWIDQLPQHAAMAGFPPAKAFTPERWLQDGDTVSVGNIVFDVVFCPGHTPGHVVFVCHAAKLAIVGDVLFKGSIGRTDFPMSNHDDLIASITKKLWRLGDDITFIPGHGPTSTFGDERRTNPFVADPAYR